MQRADNVTGPVGRRDRLWHLEWNRVLNNGTCERFGIRFPREFNRISFKHSIASNRGASVVPLGDNFEFWKKRKLSKGDTLGVGNRVCMQRFECG